jgi:allantoicase
VNADGNFADGAKVTPFAGAKHKICDLAVSSDGKYVYAVTDSTDGSESLLVTDGRQPERRNLALR